MTPTDAGPTPTTPGLNHLALRVADAARSRRFYEQAFGAVAGTRAIERSGELVEILLDAPPGSIQRGHHMFLGSNGIELIEVVEPAVPLDQPERMKRAVLHVCLQVDDVRLSAGRVEEAGGKLLFPVREVGGRPVVYCSDPDGHVLELIQMSFAEAVAGVLEVLPDAAPDPSEGFQHDS